MAEDCNSILGSVTAPKVEIVRTRFSESVELAESQIVSSMGVIVEEIVALNASMKESISSSDSLKEVISDKFDEDTVEGIVLKNVHTQHGTSADGHRFYVMFNKCRALQTLAMKFFTDAESIFTPSAAKSMFPRAFQKLTQCKEDLGNVDMQTAQRAIANLTAMTSLFRGLQTGETRNVLANKALKGFSSMKLKPSKAFLKGLSQHATPDLYEQYLKLFTTTTA